MLEKTLIFRIEINKKHNFWKISYHSWFGTHDDKTSVIEQTTNFELLILLLSDVLHVC